MENNFILSKETAGYLEAVLAMDEAYSAVYTVVDDTLDGKPIEEVEKAIAPFQERFNEAKKELYNLLTEHIQTMLYEHYNKGDKDILI